jgi:hypothetical protein
MASDYPIGIFKLSLHYDLYISYLHYHWLQNLDLILQNRNVLYKILVLLPGISLINIYLLYPIDEHPKNKTLHYIYLFICLLCLTPLSAIFQLYHGDQF